MPSPSDLWPLAVLALVLLTPVGLTLWQRGRRSDNAVDRFTQWFRSELFYRRLLLALWCGWPFVAIPVVAQWLIGCISGGVFECYKWVIAALFFLLPPALTVIACKVLSAPAFAGVPEMGWTRGRLLRQALWLQLGIVAVGVCLGYAADAQAADHVSGGLLGAVAALGVMMMCSIGWFRSRQVAQSVLPPGELRERLFELAEQTQVRVRQGCLLPSATWRLINVLSLIGGNVYLPPELLTYLSRREVDALMALELGRLWRMREFQLVRIVAFLFLILLSACVLAGILAFFVAIEYPGILAFIPIVLALPCCMCGGHRFASVWDRAALAVTGDPEALITLLAKLHRLQMLPIVAGKQPSTAGSSLADWPRLQRLAHLARIPSERLREILERPGSGEDRYRGSQSEVDPKTAPAKSRGFSP